MKVYKKIIFDKNNNILFEDSYNYSGPLGECGIHYDYKSTRSTKAMQKKAKREKKLAERLEIKKAKRQAKEGTKDESDKSLDTSKPITLDFLTNPDKK